MKKIHEYKTFIDRGMNPPLAGYKKITAYIVFDVKYDQCKRAMLVGVDTTLPTHDVLYSGIASLCFIHAVLFISVLNG